LKKEIKTLLLKDCITIISILAALWLILCYMMVQVSAIAPNHSVKIGILIAGILVGTFSTASSVAVFIHIRINREDLYSKELNSTGGLK
jgi:hypothetical protein